MSATYRVGGTEYRVRVDGSADAARVVVTTVDADGSESAPRTLAARIVPVDGGRSFVEIDGVARLVHVAATRATIDVALDGEHHRVVPPGVLAKRRRGASGGEVAEAVTPPMPGQVVKVLVEVGQDVVRGQDVVVLSAMKMETSLKAPFDGKVTAIHVREGAQVMPGQVLVDLAPAAAAASAEV